MSQTPVVNLQGYLSFPIQKLSDKKKTKSWYEENVNFAENILVTDHNLRASFKNKRTNFNLRANIIDSRDFERFINPDNLD